MKIKYTVKEVKPQVFAVIIKDGYDRAMTFCRVQEYYESPNNKFRGKDFSIWDFMKWYGKKHGSFSYAQDWAGFNVPLAVAMNCYNRYMSGLAFETPYDKAMYDIIRHAWAETIKNNTSTGYIIGAESLEGETFKHEMCHALYSINEDYKNEVDEITSSLEVEHSKAFAYNLLNMGYTAEVIPDEIQAYLSTNYSNPRFSKDVPKDALFSYHEKYLEIIKKY